MRMPSRAGVVPTRRHSGLDCAAGDRPPGSTPTGTARPRGPAARRASMARCDTPGTGRGDDPPPGHQRLPPQGGRDPGLPVGAVAAHRPSSFAVLTASCIPRRPPLTPSRRAAGFRIERAPGRLLPTPAPARRVRGTGEDTGASRRRSTPPSPWPWWARRSGRLPCSVVLRRRPGGRRRAEPGTRQALAGGAEPGPVWRCAPGGIRRPRPGGWRGPTCLPWSRSLPAWTPSACAPCRRRRRRRAPGWASG